MEDQRYSATVRSAKTTTRRSDWTTADKTGGLPPAGPHIVAAKSHLHLSIAGVQKAGRTAWTTQSTYR